MSSLKRCATAQNINGRMVHYPSDGTGRDTYIGLQSGGIWKDIQIQSTKPEVGTFYPKRAFRPAAPIMVPKFRHYQSDGSGRDNYVIQDEGGLAPSSQKFLKRSNFISSLRSYDKMPLIPKNDIFYLAQTPSAQSQKEYLRQQQLAKSQNNLISRLSRPKTAENLNAKSLKRLPSAFASISQIGQQS